MSFFYSLFNTEFSKICKLIRKKKYLNDTLDLYKMKLTDKDILYLCRLLMHDNIIKVIYLDKNKITNIGGDALNNLLYYNYSIEFINLDSNKIDQEIIIKIYNKIIENVKKKNYIYILTFISYLFISLLIYINIYKLYNLILIFFFFFNIEIFNKIIK